MSSFHLEPSAASAREWASALRHAFDERTRGRGLRYVDDVELAVDQRGKVFADVWGSRPEPYLVAFDGEYHEEAVLAMCTCPVGESERACKHLFAVLCALDRVRLGRARPCELYLGGLDHRALQPAGALRHLAVPPPRPPAPPTWRDRVAPWPSARAPRKSRPVHVEYIVRAEPLGRARGRAQAIVATEADRVGIQVATLAATRDASVRRSIGLDLGRALDPVDAAHLAAFHGIETMRGYATGTYASIEQPTRRALGAWIERERVPAIAAALAATGRFGWLPAGLYEPAPLSRLAWDADGPWRIALSMTPGRRGGHVALGALVRGADRIPLEELDALAGGGFAIARGMLRAVDAEGLGRWWHLLAGGTEVPGDEVEAFLTETCARFAPELDLGAIGWTVHAAALVPRVVLALPRGSAAFEARAELGYGDRVPDGDDAVIVDAGRREVLRRDLAAERAAAAALRGLGGRLDRTWSIPAARLRAFVEAAAAAGWTPWLEGRRVRGVASMKPRVQSGVDWFDVTIDIGGEPAAAMPELLAALRSDRPFVKLSDGTIALIPPWLEARARILAAATPADGAARFRAADALLVSAVVDAAGDADVDAAFAAIRDRLRGVTEIAPRQPPAGFGATLRDYQADGLGWLWFLRDVGLGGCLADDMGLGKTVQVLALLAGARAAGRGPHRPSLVVAPRSLVFHWIDEARRFAPALRTLEWHGGGRDGLAAQLPAADLVVTTYATLRRDIERLAAQPYATVVLDEAQAIKNAASQSAKACRRLRADHRLALTGTPVENRLDDLASIFEFLDPGLLGQPAVLRAAAAGETEVDQARALGRLLRPVLLRRTKDEVLTELPGKTEVVIGCRLEGKERARYEQMRDHYRAALLHQIERDGVAKSALVVLEALLRLRQATLHPGLLDPALAGEPSAKLDALVEHLHDALGSGHRALVFSQFTTLLDIVRRRLEREGIAYEYLDGKTRDRRERVAAFQTGGAGVFLLSLKAGGTGLNLTAADHVFLLDPWWNPAVEAQAIDRVHRIGQSRPVTAYRLVAEDTVEAKILALQDHKRALFTGVFEDKGVMSRLTADDLRALLD